MVLLDQRDRGDPVHGEGGVLAPPLVVALQESAGQRHRADHALAAAALGVDVAQPDRQAGADGAGEEFERARRRHPGDLADRLPAPGRQRGVARAHLPHGGVQLVGRERPGGGGVLGAGPSSRGTGPGRGPGEDGAARVLTRRGVARLAQHREHLVGAQAADQHARGEPAQLGRRRPPVVEHLGEQAVVVGADVALDRPRPGADRAAARRRRSGSPAPGAPASGRPW